MAISWMFIAEYYHCTHIYRHEILNYEVMACYCKGCKLKQELRTNNLEVYEVWYVSHDWDLNVQGSVSKVEATGAKNIFKCSITKHYIRYIHFMMVEIKQKSSCPLISDS